MTFEQWVAIAGRIDEWWPATEFDEGHIKAYFPELERYDADEIMEAVRACLPDGSAFAPSLAQLTVKLERPKIDLPPWVKVFNRLRWAVGREVGEEAAIQSLFREHAAIAQFVLDYGYQRLRNEPFNDPQLAGVIEKRIKDSWEDFAERWRRDQGRRYARTGAAAALERRRSGELRKLSATDVVAGLPSAPGGTLDRKKGERGE